MSTNSSRPPLPATHRGTGKEAFAYLSPDKSQAMIQAGMLQLSVKISRQAAPWRRHRVTRLKAPRTWPPSHGYSNPWKTLKPPSLDCRK